MKFWKLLGKLTRKRSVATTRILYCTPCYTSFSKYSLSTQAVPDIFCAAKIGQKTDKVPALRELSYCWVSSYCWNLHWFCLAFTLHFCFQVETPGSEAKVSKLSYSWHCLELSRTSRKKCADICPWEVSELKAFLRALPTRSKSSFT